MGLAGLQTAPAAAPDSPASSAELHFLTFPNHLQCHEHLVLELGPNVNLIVGKNGSGKSTLLVALQCCLGARASATGR